MALEFVLITVVGFIPLGQYDVVANVLISFVCSMQVETFRRVHGHPFASTMCTGNLRSGTEALCQYFKTGGSSICICSILLAIATILMAKEFRI